jgi:hypothetical protein
MEELMKKYLTVLMALIFCGGLASLFAQDSVNVTFSVNMSVQIKKGYFKPDSAVITCVGAFNNWLNTPPDNNTKIATDDNKDSIYTYTIKVGANASYEYKFNIGITWGGKDELSGGKPNRKATIGAKDTVLPVVYYNNENPPSGNPSPVTFSVDMRLPAKSSFNPATQKVYVAGDFTNPTWQNGAIEMTDPNNDTIYTVTTNINSNKVIQFKYLYSTGAASAGTWESTDNRTYFVLDTGNKTTAFWENKNPNVQVGNGSIIFTVDMSVMQDAGVFDPNTDSLQLRGNFNGWNDVPAAHMDQNPLNPALWTVTAEFKGVTPGDQQLYKFMIKIADTSKIHYHDGYERPVNMGGGNRTINFLAQDNQDAGTLYYDNVQPAWAIPSGTNIPVTFQVDMTPAMDSAKQAIPFNPATDKLYWISEQPSFVATQGWYDSDQMTVLELKDDNGDKIYTGTLTPKTPTFNSFEYRYAFIHKDAGSGDESWISEPSGFSAFAYRVRYIHQTGNNAFVNPYTMNKDTWTNAEIKPASEQETDPFNNLSGVVETGNKALTFKLNQNYPNPFNPATKISFSIPQAGQVSLKIYNILGEEIATVLNKELKAGNYTADFDASRLTSGVYFYTITAGQFTSTKKMLLLK